MSEPDRKKEEEPTEKKEEKRFCDNVDTIKTYIRDVIDTAAIRLRKEINTGGLQKFVIQHADKVPYVGKPVKDIGSALYSSDTKQSKIEALMKMYESTIEKAKTIEDIERALRIAPVQTQDVFQGRTLEVVEAIKFFTRQLMEQEKNENYHDELLFINLKKQILKKYNDFDRLEHYKKPETKGGVYSTIQTVLGYIPGLSSHKIRDKIAKLNRINETLKAAKKEHEDLETYDLFYKNNDFLLLELRASAQKDWFSSDTKKALSYLDTLKELTDKVGERIPDKEPVPEIDELIEPELEEQSLPSSGSEDALEEQSLPSSESEEILPSDEETTPLSPEEISKELYKSTSGEPNEQLPPASDKETHTPKV